MTTVKSFKTLVPGRSRPAPLASLVGATVGRTCSCCGDPSAYNCW